MVGRANAAATSLLEAAPPGRALDLAAGEGRMALWLAGRGWQVTALDFSAAGLARGQARAAELGVDVDWQVADATTAELGKQIYHLVLVLYLHLPRETLSDVLRRAAAAVGPGVAGLVAAWRRRQRAPSPLFQLGLVVAGWGIFNIVEGIIDHMILGVHHVRDDLGGPLSWDIGFLVFGVLLVAVGTPVHKAGDRST